MAPERAVWEKEGMGRILASILGILSVMLALTGVSGMRMAAGADCPFALALAAAPSHAMSGHGTPSNHMAADHTALHGGFAQTPDAPNRDMADHASATMTLCGFGCTLLAEAPVPAFVGPPLAAHAVWVDGDGPQTVSRAALPVERPPKALA